MNAIVLTLFVASASSPLTSGEYRVVHDSVDVDSDLWDPSCGAVPDIPVDKKGTRYQVTIDDGAATFMIESDNRKFGRKACEGENPSLAAQSTFKDGARRVMKCKSTRVVKGTEETAHTLEPLGNGKIKISARFEQRARVRRYDCRLAIDRHTILVPYVEEKAPMFAPDDTLHDDALTAPTDGVADAPTSDGVTSTGTAVKPRPTTPKFTEASIEKDLARALARAKDEADLSAVSFRHENKMSRDYTLLESKYVLDGKELTDNGRRWSTLKPGESRTVLDDVVPTGVHVLEVELRYATTLNGQPVKLRVRDALFFDVEMGVPTKVALVGGERDGILIGPEEKPELRFFLNGKRAQK